MNENILKVKLLPTCATKLEIKELDISQQKYKNSVSANFPQKPDIKIETIETNIISIDDSANQFPKFSVSSQFSQGAALELFNKGVKPMVVLFANAEHPGGYGENAPAQEERVLKDSNASYAIPKDYQNGLNITYGGCYVISDVIIKVEDNNKTKKDVRADFTFVAMPDLHIYEGNLESYYAKPENRAAYLRHITSLMILQFHAAKLGSGVMVTGRQGCGVFQNNDEDVAAVIHAVANLPEFKDVKVVYALGRDSVEKNNKRKTHEIYSKPLQEKLDEVNKCIENIRQDKNVDENLEISKISHDMKNRYCKNIKPYISLLSEQCNQIRDTLNNDMKMTVEVLLYGAERYQFKFNAKEEAEKFSENIFKKYDIGGQDKNKIACGSENDIVLTTEQFKLLRSKLSQVSGRILEKPENKQSNTVNEIKKIKMPRFSPTLVCKEDKENNILPHSAKMLNLPISDHGVLVANTAVGVIVSLNIWNPGSAISPSKNPKNPNTKSVKFSVQDKNEQAEQMIKMAEYVFNMAKAGAAMFALQEVPLSDSENFKIFNAQLEILCYEHNIKNPNNIVNLQFTCQHRTHPQNFSTCALINTGKLEINDATLALDKKHPMSGRCGYYEIKSKTDNKVISLFNIHGNFENRDETEKFIEATARSQKAVVCGDANIQKAKLNIDDDALDSSEKFGNTLDVFYDSVTPALIAFEKIKLECSKFNFEIFYGKPEENGLPRYQFELKSQTEAQNFSKYIYSQFGIGSRENPEKQKFCIDQKNGTSFMMFTKGQFDLLKFKISPESIISNNSVFSSNEMKKIAEYKKELEEELDSIIVINEDEKRYKFNAFTMILKLAEKGYPRSEILKYIETDYPDVGKTHVTSSRAAKIFDELKSEELRGSPIYLRYDQSIAQIENDSDVVICAPEWVQKVLDEQISPWLKGKAFTFNDIKGKKIIGFTVGEKVTLQQLEMIARNETVNTSGKIDKKAYQNTGLSDEQIYAIKDIVRQLVIVGKDKVNSYGGYNSREQVLDADKREEAYICDLIGLQFQQPENTGRLVLIGQPGVLPKGGVDNVIYENVVGEKRPDYSTCKNDKERYLEVVTANKQILYFDKKAYCAFVANDFVLTALSLEKNAQKRGDKNNIDFRFLAYGTGFFAVAGWIKSGDTFNAITKALILYGIKEGLETLFRDHKDKLNNIKRISLPFYDNSKDAQDIRDEIIKLCQENGMDCEFNQEDALKPKEGFTTATTNCADPHAPTGNEMGYSSVDAAICENIDNKGNTFSPVLNKKMGAEVINVKKLKKEISQEASQGVSIVTSTTSTTTSINKSLAGSHTGFFQNSPPKQQAVQPTVQPKPENESTKMPTTTIKTNNTKK